MLVLLLAATAAFAQKILIKGTVSGDTKGRNKVYITDLNAYNDTASIENGKFILEIPFKGAQALFMHMEYEPGYRAFRVVFDKPGTIHAQMDAQSYAVKFSGLETPTIFNDFNNKEIAMHRQVNEELKKKFGSAFLDPGMPKYNELMLERDRLSKEKMLTLLKEQADKFPGSYATTYALAEKTTAYPLVLKEELYNKLSAVGKKTEKGKELNAMIQGTKNSAIGISIGDFTLNDPDGNHIALSKFKGRYVLVDFWASWCSPCRASFPRLKVVYETFHKKGLEILSVSIDVDSKNWLKAVEEENMPWDQVLDTKQIAKSRFAVSAIPNMFLISPEGKLLFKELGSNPNGGSEMEKMLEEIFKEKI